MGNFTFCTLVSKLFISLCVLIFSTLPVVAQDEYPGDEIVLKLANATDLAAVAGAYGLDPVFLDQFGSRPIYRLRILDGTTPLNKAAALTSDAAGRVLYAEPNFNAVAPEVSGISWASGIPWAGGISWASGDPNGSGEGNWYRNRIRLPEAHSLSRGAGITVAVLDTGVDRAHPALAGKLVSGFDFVDFDNDPSEVGTRATHPLYGHGTHVTGLVAASAPESKIVPIRVLDTNGVGNIWVLAEALLYAANLDPDGNPATDDQVRVINMSIATRRPTALLNDVIGDITCGFSDDGDDDDESGGSGTIPVTNRAECLTEGRGGIVVVASAGNRGSTIAEYPAAESINIGGALAVAASNRQDRRAAFSNWGSWVEIAAPGDVIISSVPGGGYGVWGGTSMASPLVAGQAALIRSYHRQRQLTATQVVNHIISSSAMVGGQVPFRVDAAASLSTSPW